MQKALLCLPLLLASLAQAGGAGAPAPAPAPGTAPQRVDTTLNFGDFTSKAQWTYPAQGSGKWPAVLLIHGSTPADMDFTVQDRQGKVTSHIFADLASALSARGIAVLRYNKHYVSGPGQADYEKFYGKANLNTFLKDAETALNAMKQNPRVDPKRIYVYGWSEGSTVAAALVRAHPEVAGLIVQGPVVQSWQDTFLAQLNDVQLPYLREVAPGGLTPANFMGAASGPGGGVATSGVAYALDPKSYATGKPALNMNAFDTDKNGTIDLKEFRAGVQQVIQDNLTAPDGFFAIYGKDALPSVTAQLSDLKQPVLVLQGANDANTPAAYAQKFLGGQKNVTLKIYPGLGHSLGPASSMIDDRFRPIAAQPMQDAANWILKK